ncbi:MAG: hypothetical protein JXD18_08355 [Anaerolineae bacterium]|nr:hypothetical protein [Anaerolineae bacterium]
MAAGTEERLKILQMVEEGKISAEEATALLRAMDSGRHVPPAVPDTTQRHFLRIQVTDLASGNAKVNVTLPMGLVSAGLRMAERFAPDADIDLQELEELLAGGAMGKLVEVVDSEDNERVEIYVE